MTEVNQANFSGFYKRNATSIEMFRLVMSQHESKFILSHLRFDEKFTRAVRQAIDKLAATRKLFDNFVSNCQKYYKSSDHMTIDDTLKPFRGRCWCRQHVLSNPIHMVQTFLYL